MPDAPFVTDALAGVARELVAELEQRFPYAAALLSDVAGVRILDTGAEQSAEQLPPARGIVFTVYDGGAFREYATGDLAPDRLSRDLRAWAGGLSRASDRPPLAADPPASPAS